MQSILLATVLALVVGLTLTPWVIDVFRARGIGKVIREDGPATHFVKHGTPTMGGIVLMVAATLGYAGAHLRWSDGTLRFQQFSRAGIVIFGTAWALGILGVIDDLLGIRPTKSLGLNKRAKTAGQIVVALALALAALRWVGLESRVTWAGAPMDWLPALPQLLFALYIFVIIWGTSNGANFADGADGLARRLGGDELLRLHDHRVLGVQELRLLSAARARRRVRAPGRRGRVGRVARRVHRLPVVERRTRADHHGRRRLAGDRRCDRVARALHADAAAAADHRRAVRDGDAERDHPDRRLQAYQAVHGTGRRVFAMAPFHHHFELRGWAEFTVIVRFWLIAALAAGLGLALFYMDFLSHGG